MARGKLLNGVSGAAMIGVSKLNFLKIEAFAKAESDRTGYNITPRNVVDRAMEEFFKRVDRKEN